MKPLSSLQYDTLSLGELIQKAEEAMVSMNFDAMAQILPPLSLSIGESPHNGEWAKALYYKARINILNGNIIVGLEDALPSYYYFRDAQEERIQCSLNTVIAYCCTRLGLFDQAIEHLSEAHLLAKKNAMPEQMARSLKLLADTYGIMHNYEAAVTYCNDALEISERYNIGKMTVASLFALAQAYSSLGKYDEALTTANKAITVSTATNDPWDMDIAYFVQGIVYQSMKQYKKALASMKESEKIVQQLPPTVARLWQVRLQKCTCLSDAGKTKQALREALVIVKAAPIQGDRLFRKAVHALLARIYSALGDKTNANKHAKIETELHLQHSGEELQQKVRALTVAFNAKRFQLEARLERERAQQLEMELQVKERELTTLALNLAQKNETLAAIEEKLRSLESSLGSARKSVQTSMKSLINSVKSDIHSSVHSDKAWDVFEQQFTSIHPGFVERLSQRHAEFKPMELRLCALMKVNLSTKQIANILCIDSRSVDVYRSRIRKKIGMERSDNLIAYLTAI